MASFCITHYDDTVQYDPCSFAEDASIISTIRSGVYESTISSEVLTDAFAKYLEDREMSFYTERDLVEAHQDIVLVSCEMLARLGARIV